jgi:hypothetical protein
VCSVLVYYKNAGLQKYCGCKNGNGRYSRQYNRILYYRRGLLMFSIFTFPSIFPLLQCQSAHICSFSCFHFILLTLSTQIYNSKPLSKLQVQTLYSPFITDCCLQARKPLFVISSLAAEEGQKKSQHLMSFLPTA